MCTYICTFTNQTDYSVPTSPTCHPWKHYITLTATTNSLSRTCSSGDVVVTDLGPSPPPSLCFIKEYHEGIVSPFPSITRFPSLPILITNGTKLRTDSLSSFSKLFCACSWSYISHSPLSLASSELNDGNAEPNLFAGFLFVVYTLYYASLLADHTLQGC